MTLVCLGVPSWPWLSRKSEYNFNPISRNPRTATTASIYSCARKRASSSLHTYADASFNPHNDFMGEVIFSLRGGGRNQVLVPS